MGEPMTIDDVRAAMASWCLPAAQAAQLRALLDDHARLAACDEGEHHEITRLRAEVERLTQERDEARTEEQATRARWQSSLVSLRTGTLERERDAALAREARLRAAAERAITMIGWDGGEARRDLEAAIEADDTATTWLADRERAARAKALEEAADALTSHDITSDIGEQLADADDPSDLAEVTADRDRLAAALAEVREAADALVECVDAIDGDALRYGLGPALDAADTVRNLASIPADLADAHDARVRAEALREAAPRVGKECRSGHEAETWLRAEAERVGGGR